MLIAAVLIMIVALTVGLSLASRTITNLRISRQNEESQRAFQAAEAGVEQILQSGGTSSSDNLTNNASFSTSVSYPSGTSIILNGGELVDQDVGLDVWLSNYPDYSSQIGSSTPANLTVYWGTDNQTSCDNPTGNEGSSVKSALEIAVLSGDKLLPTMTKYVYEVPSCTASPRPITHSVNAPGTGGTVATIHFNNSATIQVSNGLIARIIPIFNSSKIAVTSDVALPKQGTVISSTGNSGQTARKVEYFASYPQIPLEIFPYSIMSQ